MIDNHQTAVLLMSLDWEEALISYSLPGMSFVEVNRLGAKAMTMAKSEEESSVGRIKLKGLEADSVYEVEVRWNKGVKRLTFRTLPEPKEALRLAWAVVGDTHISKKTENRKGRLFVESASILRDLVGEWNALRVAGVFVAGDITNYGERREYEAASDIFKELKCQLAIVPGDHDINNGKYELWNEVFGRESFMLQFGEFVVVGLDTSSHYLGTNGRQRIEEVLKANTKAIILVSHLQLFPDLYIRSSDKVICDYEESRPLLDELTRRPVLAYIGHQNALARISAGKLTQINLPQPVQFPCGWVLARLYGNRLYHTYRPICSEVLDDYSRIASNAAAEYFQEPQWQQNYRLGSSISAVNFMMDINIDGN